MGRVVIVVDKKLQFQVLNISPKLIIILNICKISKTSYNFEMEVVFIVLFLMAKYVIVK